MKRRLFLGTLTAAVAAGAAPRVVAQPIPAPAVPAPTEVRPFAFDDVVAIAADLAGRKFEAPRSTMTAPFKDLGYDAYRGIRFRREADPWHDLPDYGLDLLAPGMLFTDPVRINLVEQGVSRPLPFDPSVFQFDTISFPPDAAQMPPGDMGWSGFRLRTRLNRPDFLDELAVFQGASYYRVLGRGSRYGLSARGLALGTGGPQGEEFPGFREFWIQRPAGDSGSITVWALLDSPSAAGAYQFDITPGTATMVGTRLALFPRRDLTDVGIAPMTSMFWFGPQDGAGHDDYRPAVHDSDGVEMVTGAGQHLWRVLNNPAKLQISAFVDQDPRAFGLMQRERDFADFQDAEAAYQLRPSAWVRPRGDWGRGAVVLVEIPVENEFHDNIVTFWQPADPLKAGERRDFAYDMNFGDSVGDDAPLARVRSTRSGTSVNGRGARTFIVDFDLGLFTDQPDPTASVSASQGKIEHPYLVRIPELGLMRLAFEFRPEGASLADLTAVLNGPGGAVSETWVFRWSDG